MTSPRLEWAARDALPLGTRLALKVLNSQAEPSPRKQLYGRLYSELNPRERARFWRMIAETYARHPPQTCVVPKGGPSDDKPGS